MDVRATQTAKINVEIECIGIEKEVGSTRYDNSVTDNAEERYSEAYLPFLCDPTKKLVDNFETAEKLYQSKVKN